MHCIHAMHLVSSIVSLRTCISDVSRMFKPLKYVKVFNTEGTQAGYTTKYSICGLRETRNQDENRFILYHKINSYIKIYISPYILLMLLNT